MFEQSLYDQEALAPAPQSHEGELFHNYELRSWNLTPRIYKIIGVSALINLLFLGVVSQTDILTRKGCDSPFAATVCQVIDAAFVANALFGTQREYVDAVYDKTELKDSDVTFVDVSDAAPPLEYPDGYFALANPNDPTMFPQAVSPDGGYIAPGIPTNPNQNDLLNSKPDIPQANPNSIIGQIPSSPLGDSVDSSTFRINKKRRGGQRFPGVSIPSDSNTAAGNTMANANTGPIANSNTATATTQPPADEATQDQFGVYINKRPLKDKAKDTLEKVAKDGVKLDKSFKVIIAGSLGLGTDGKTIVLKNPKVVPFKQTVPQDPQLVKLVQDWILAVGDAGWFGYLDKLKSKNIVISVEQNDTELVASVKADQPSENDAKQAASGLNTLLSIAVPAAKGDEQEFLKKASTT
ncbi:MAG: hypothetical protein ACREO5_07695, partial [Candidatus Binatia bacterium]